jgi:biopolymer transport protein ExbB
LRSWIWLAALILAAGLAPEALAQEAAEATAAAAAVVPADGPDAPRTVADWYAMGGWVMHLLVLASMISLFIVLERLWALRQSAVLPRDLLRELRDALRGGQVGQLVALCTASRSSVARLMRAGLLHSDDGLPAMEDAVGAAAEQESTRLRRNLALLAAVGNMATMMGLMGTVLGMIESFDLIAKTGTGDARVVAGGIFQALVTTAAGLMVGIAAIGSHSFLRRRAEGLEIELTEKSLRMLEDLWASQGGIRQLEEDKDPAEI